MEGEQKSEGVIFDGLNSLSKCVDDLIGGLRTLRTRLEPVLCESSERECGEKDEKDKRAYSPLKVRLETIQINVSEAIDIQKDIVKRLELGA